MTETCEVRSVREFQGLLENAGLAVFGESSM